MKINSDKLIEDHKKSFGPDPIAEFYLCKNVVLDQNSKQRSEIMIHPYLLLMQMYVGGKDSYTLDELKTISGFSKKDLNACIDVLDSYIEKSKINDSTDEENIEYSILRLGQIQFINQKTETLKQFVQKYSPRK